MIRAIILSATIAALVTLWMDKPPPPVKVAQVVPYCVIDQRMASKSFGVFPDGSPALDENGKQRWRWNFSWGKGYGPCSLQDKFFEI